MRPIDADELYARLMKRYLMHNMKDDRLDVAARAAIGACMEAVNRSKTITITEPPNDPLTMEELREMDGEPVWVEVFVRGIKSHWGIVHGDYISDGKLPNEKGKCLLLIGDTGGYDITWLAYRRKPEEGTT